MEEFIEDWIPDLIEENVKITLMWNEGRGIEIPCEVVDVIIISGMLFCELFETRLIIYVMPDIIYM